MTQTIKIRILEETNNVYQFESFQKNDSVYFPCVSVVDINMHSPAFNLCGDANGNSRGYDHGYLILH